MPNPGTCRPCLTPDSELRASHIVPEFFYKRIYTKTHKFTAVSKDSEEQISINQKGYREHLLCQCCETKLSKWEGKLSQLTNNLVSEDYGSLSATRIQNVTVLTGIDYIAIKMAVISIFWRMGVASHELFASYALGPYSEIFRQTLAQNKLLTEHEFPVLISRGLIDGAFHAGILFPVGRGRYDSNLIMQSVVLNGIVFDCVMTNSRRIPEEILSFALSQAGRVLIPDRPYEQLGFNIDEFSNRMKKADIKSFFARYA